MPPGAIGATSSDILGHLHHDLRVHRPKELGMVVREMLLYCLKQLLIRATCELRPALAVGDPSLPPFDRGRRLFVVVLPLIRRPAEDVLKVTPIHGPERCRTGVGATFP